MKNKNHDDIKNLLSQDIELPESLSKENIVKKLKSSGANAADVSAENVRQFEKKKRKSSLWRIAASAAAFVVVAAGAFTIYQSTFGSNRPVMTVPATDAQIALDSSERDSEKQETYSNSAETSPVQENQAEVKSKYKALDLGLKKTNLSTFKSEKDLKNYFSNLSKNYIKNLESFNSKGDVTMAAAPEMSNGKNNKTFSDITDTDSSSSIGTGHAETNTQVDGVDEGDVIKTDDRYIYAVNDDEYLSIIDSETMKLICQKKLHSGSVKRTLSINEIYVDKNKLVVTAEEYEKTEDQNRKKMDGYYCGFGLYGKSVGSVAIVYDITDRENPTETRRVTQDGSVISSRMVGSYLYTATAYYPDLSEEDFEYAPKVDGTELTCSDVYVRDAKSGNAGYIVLSGFDTDNTKSEVSRVSVISGGSSTYCSKDTFYVVDNVYDEKSNADTTAISSFSIKDGAVAYKASGTVPGSVCGQYAMDQSGEYFRICTDGYNEKTNKYYANLYVLDESLNAIGKLEDIADDEDLKSVRFMGNTAYVVTFKNTDPLFAIDLSKPNEPKTLGEVKLPGFSEYLHPISENLLVGIGYDGDDESADFMTLKVSLFDVSNKKQPKVLSSLVIKDCIFNVSTYSAKEFVMLDENSFGLPLIKYKTAILKNRNYRENYVFTVFTVKNNKIVEKNTYDHGSETDGTFLFRGTFIKGNVFTLDDKTVRKFDMESGKLLSVLSYKIPENDDDGDSSNGSGTVTAYTAR